MDLRSPLIAVDSNYLIDLENGEEKALECLAIVRERAISPRIIVPPTVIEELAFEAQFGDEPDRSTAESALRNACRVHRFHPFNLIPTGHGIVERISDELLRKEVIPWEEKNDSLILAEAALLGCKILITSDHHLTDAKHEEFKAVLDAFHVETPIVAWPGRIISMFGR